MKALKYYKDINNPFYTLKICSGMCHAEKPHMHEELAIAYVCSGESTLYFENNPNKIRTGQMVIISPGFVHHCIPEIPDSWGYLMVLINSNWLDDAGFPSHSLPSFSVLNPEIEASKSIVLNFEKLKSKPFNSDEILLEFLNIVVNQLENIKYSIEAQQGAENLTSQIISNLSSDLSKPIKLDEISQKFQINKYALIRVFRQFMNTTPQKYHLMLRLNQAKSKLEKGCDIIDTALEYGFYDQSHFSKSFKAAYGLPPKKFQDLISRE